MNKQRVQKRGREKPSALCAVQTWAVIFVDGGVKMWANGAVLGDDGQTKEFDSWVACEQAIRRVPTGEAEIRDQARRWAHGKLSGVGDLRLWNPAVPVQVWGAFLREVEVEIDRYFEYQMAGLCGD